MNHLEFAASESAALEPSDWEKWVNQVETILGHDLDGNETEDGYSLGYASDAWEAGKTPEQYAASVRIQVARIRLTDLAEWLNKWYGLELAKLATSGPRQGLADETPYLQVARAHTPADILVAVSIMDSLHYRIEVYTSTAWVDLGDPFMVQREFYMADAAFVVSRFLPYTPTV